MQKCNIKKLKLFQGYLSFDVAHSHHMTKYPFEDTEKQHGARKISAKKQLTENINVDLHKKPLTLNLKAH